jgi:soluble lytic murein transglycosylase-like protein|tara:strand:+ start:5029 stop:5580 length:552 start_codon:yes stop_codon:yes gene_type:complete
MKYFTQIFTIFIITLLFCQIRIKDRSIENLNNKIKYNKQITDSLYLKIDTLKQEYKCLKYIINWDHNVNNITTNLLSAIIYVESSNNDSAINLSEDAVGCLQIRKCMVNDVNRILKRQRSTQRFIYSDRWDRYKSIQMFEIYREHYNLNTDEEIARSWNGGPNGMNNPLTVQYWDKVINKLNS